MSAGAGLIVLDGRVQVPLQAPVGGYLCQPGSPLWPPISVPATVTVYKAPYDDSIRCQRPGTL